MKKICFTILLGLIISGVRGQEDKRILITGTVKTMNLEPIPFAHVIINHKKGMATDNTGKFMYLGYTSDTITFSAIGFKKGKYIVPDVSNKKEYIFTKILLSDTILLKEARILKWHTYKEFKDDVAKSEIPQDDYSRAQKNLKVMMDQYVRIMDDPDIPAPSSACQNYVQMKRNFQSYSIGQSTPISLFNVAAWAELIKAIQRGDFKKKKKDNDDEYQKPETP